MLRTRRFWLIVATLTLLASLTFWWLSSGSAWPAYQLTRADINETVVGSGRVIPPAKVELASMVNGTVAQITVKEGAQCKAGQTLLMLDDAELRGQLLQARGQQAQAAAKLEQVHELSTPQSAQAVKQAETSLANAKRILERNRMLAKTGFVSPAAIDESQQQFDLAASRLASAQSGLNSNQQGGDLAAAEATLQSAIGTVQISEAKLKQLSLRAPADCTVLTRTAEVGQVAQVGKVLLTLALHGPTRISMLVDEKRLARLAIGQPATVLADAFPTQPFMATVQDIAPGIDRDTGTVELKLTVPNPPAFLRADMTVSIEIRVAERRHALVLPSDAVFSQDRQSWVWRVSDGTATKQYVNLGLAGIGKTEILNGLTEGDIVLAPGSKPIAAGMSVKPQVSKR